MAPSDVSVLGVAEIRADFDVIVLAIGSTRPRDLFVEGRSHNGVHFAMEYLKSANLVCEGLVSAPTITAKDKHVVIIGGGDTGADCLGTVHRQGAASAVFQLEILPGTSRRRARQRQPVADVARHLAELLRHMKEGGTATVCRLRRKRLVSSAMATVRYGRCPLARWRWSTLMVGSNFDRSPDLDRELPADLVLLALGFTGPEQDGVVKELGCALNARGNITVDVNFTRPQPKAVFACGDAAAWTEPGRLGHRRRPWIGSGRRSIVTCRSTSDLVAPLVGPVRSPLSPERLPNTMPRRTRCHQERSFERRRTGR